MVKLGSKVENYVHNHWKPKFATNELAQPTRDGSAVMMRCRVVSRGVVLLLFYLFSRAA